MRNFIFLDHTADISVELQADSLENLFIAGVEAYKKIMFENVPLTEDDSVALYLSENSPEELLGVFLNELNEMSGKRNWAAKSIDSTRLVTEDGVWKFECNLSGGALAEEYYPNYEIREASYTGLKIKEKDGVYSINIIFEINREDT